MGSPLGGLGHAQPIAGCLFGSILYLNVLQVGQAGAKISLPAPVAQRIERGSPKAEVGGSTPSWGAETCNAIATYVLLNSGIIKASDAWVPPSPRRPMLLSNFLVITIVYCNIVIFCNVIV